MAEVGVRQLKQQLSHYLDRAESGETVIVTDRGRPKAQLVPIAGRARVEEGIAMGWVAPPSGAALEPIEPWRGTTTVADALAEDRGR